MIATAPRSKSDTNQDVGTDPLFWKIAHEEFDFMVDLAAAPDNAKCPVYFWKTEGANESKGGSLDLAWHAYAGWQFLNPPFKDITPWARKCLLEASLGAKIAMLVPAAVDSNWFDEFVWGKSQVRWLKGRLVFDFIHQKDSTTKNKDGSLRYKAGDKNTDPYPKPMMLCLFERGRCPGADVWDWKAGLPNRGRLKP